MRFSKIQLSDTGTSAVMLPPRTTAEPDALKAAPYVVAFVDACAVATRKARNVGFIVIRNGNCSMGVGREVVLGEQATL